MTPSILLEVGSKLLCKGQEISTKKTWFQHQKGAAKVQPGRSRAAPDPERLPGSTG